MMTVDGPNDESVKASARRTGWDDPAIAAGNAPPLPWWPLWATAAMWAFWVCYLAVTVMG